MDTLIAGPGGGRVFLVEAVADPLGPSFIRIGDTEIAIPAGQRFRLSQADVPGWVGPVDIFIGDTVVAWTVSWES